MKATITLVLLCITSVVFSQIKMEMTPKGFATVKIDRPAKTLEKLIEKTQSWASYYNRNNRYSFDVYDISENTVSIDAFKENAFYYRNRGEAYQHRIKYSMRVEFIESFYTITFAVKDIYSGNNITKLTVAEFYASDGRLKEDYEEVKPSLEYTANSIINDFATFLATD